MMVAWTNPSAEAPLCAAVMTSGALASQVVQVASSAWSDQSRALIELPAEHGTLLFLLPMC